MTGAWRRDEVDPKFIREACAWMGDPATVLLAYVWTAYDSLCADAPAVDGRDLERSITQLLVPRIRKAMSGFAPYDVEHGPFEHETMAPPPAQPPAYDLAFVFPADERVMWPIEAKVLETPGAVAGYVDDVNHQFLTCRYAPFSNAGAMLGYLLSGAATLALDNIGARLGCTLKRSTLLAGRPQRFSEHERKVPAGKSYPKQFTCHHLVLEFFELKRSSEASSKRAAKANM